MVMGACSTIDPGFECLDHFLVAQAAIGPAHHSPAGVHSLDLFFVHYFVFQITTQRAILAITFLARGNQTVFFDFVHYLYQRTSFRLLFLLVPF